MRALFVHRVPLPYSVGDDYGPVPPWLDDMMILVPDAQLIWRNLPNVRRTYVDIFSPAKNAAARTALLRRFVPTIPAEFDNNPTWSIALDSHGYRNGEIPIAKPAATLRIACVGDSWTFGMNVDQDHSYPGRLLAASARRAWRRERRGRQLRRARLLFVSGTAADQSPRLRLFIPTSSSSASA